MMMQVILWVVLWAYVIYAFATYDPKDDPHCNYDMCPYCPFPCDERRG